MSIHSFTTPNFQIQYDDSIFPVNTLTQVAKRAQDMQAACETDFALLCGWFGLPVGTGFGPTNRVIVTLDPNIRGASNNGYSTHNPHITVNGLGATLDSTMSLFVAEMSEILMVFPGKWKWNSGDSGGEGLSRVSADILHPASAPNGVNNNVNAWLASDPTTDTTAAVADSVFRKNWVASNFTGGPLKAGGSVPGDQDSYSFGCSMLFINYLRTQLGFSINQICQDGTGTLEGTFKAISHASVDGFPQFLRVIEQKFPNVGMKSTSDNPFPIAWTNVSAGGAGRSDNMFIFSRMLDGRILYNQAAPGKAFVGWQEVPGGLHTDVALAAGMQNNTLFVFAKDQTGRIQFNQAAPGGAFVGWQVLTGGVTTNVALAAAGRKDNLFVFARALDGRILYNQAAPGKAFVGWQEVPGGLHTDVALAAGMQKETLFVFAKGLDSKIYFNQAAPGGAFVGWQVLAGGVTTNVALAAAGRQNNLFVFAKGLDGRILFNQAAPGQAFVGWQEVPGGLKADVALGAAMQNTTLFVFAKSAQGTIIFNQAAEGGAFVGWQGGI